MFLILLPHSLPPPIKEHGSKILKLLRSVFSCLPLATLIDQKVLIVHGGVSDKTDLEELAKIDRRKVQSLSEPSTNP